MKNYKFLFVSLALLLNTSVFAISEDNIKNEMEVKISKVITILSKQDSKKDFHSEEIFTLFDHIFDFKVMSLISLGKNYKKLNQDEKQRFQKAFELKLKRSFQSKLKLYTNQKMNINEIIKTKKNRLKLLTELVGDSDTYSIVYKFHKKKNIDNWLIYDVSIIDVSILNTYRKQFYEYLKNNSIDTLIKKLETKDIKK